MDNIKIFIDTDTEITFILEKILNAKSERVALVIPDRAAVLSAIVGLKLIKRVVDKSNKILVLVTLDEQGAELVRNAGLVVVSRVGEINEETWARVQKLKFEYQKKSKRSTHYLPENLEIPAAIVTIEESKHIKDLLPTKNIEQKEDLDLEDIKQDLEEISKEDIIEEPVEVIDVKDEVVEDPEINTKETPLIRIQLDSQVEDIEPENVVEMKSFDENIIEDEKVEDELEVPVEVVKKEVIEEMKSAEKEVPIIKPLLEPAYTPFRVRKVAPRKSGISNLSFAVGKDINEKKK